MISNWLEQLTVNWANAQLIAERIGCEIGPDYYNLSYFLRIHGCRFGTCSHLGKLDPLMGDISSCRALRPTFLSLRPRPTSNIVGSHSKTSVLHLPPLHPRCCLPYHLLQVQERSPGCHWQSRVSTVIIIVPMYDSNMHVHTTHQH